MIIKHSQGKIDSVYTDNEWKKPDQTKKVGKEEKSPKQKDPKPEKKEN